MKLNEWPDLIQKSVEKLAVKYFPRTFLPGAALRRLPSDSALKWFDGIHQRKWVFLKARPYINVKFKDHAPQAVPVDLVSMLVVGSSYENKERIPEAGTDVYQFKVTGEPTAVASESGENWMHFDNEDGSTVRVRQLELARCLFLHNHHLTRTAFRPNGLKGLAHPLIDGETTIIKFSSLADYPLSNLRSKAALQHLAWMLLDDDARRSFNSILVGLMSSPKELWNFHFAPPNMKNWEISGSGYYSSSDDKSFTVNEITGFDNPTRYHFNEILIDHPRFKQLLPKKPESGQRPIVQRGDPDPLLDLGYEPELGRRLDHVTDQRFTFSFDKSLQVKVLVNGLTFRIKPRVDPESVPISESTSPGHADERGTGRELNHGINSSESDDHYLGKLDDAQPSDKFSFFEGVVSRLTKRPNFSFIELKCYFLPRPRTDRHAVCQTFTGARVQCYVAWIEYRSILIAIIEVDTESMKNDRSLSNLIVSFDQDADVNHLVYLFLQSCSEAGVHWKVSQIQAFSAAWETSKHPDRNVKKRPARNITESSDQRAKEDKPPVPVDPETYKKRWVSNLHDATQKVACNMRRK